MLTLPRQRGAEAEGRGLAEREACSSPCGRKNRVSPSGLLRTRLVDAVCIRSRQCGWWPRLTCPGQSLTKPCDVVNHFPILFFFNLFFNYSRHAVSCSFRLTT